MHSYCMCQQVLANFRADCCTNCGQQHYGAVPCPTQPNNCCPAKPCLTCSSYQDPNIFSILVDQPVKDYYGNTNPALFNQKKIENNSGVAVPYTRAYSLASSHSKQGPKTGFAPDTKGTGPETARKEPISADDQRCYMLSRKSYRMEQCGVNTFFANQSGSSCAQLAPTTSSSNHSTTSLDELSDFSLCGRLGANLTTCSTVSTMGGCPFSRCSMPWIKSMCECIDASASAVHAAQQGNSNKIKDHQQNEISDEDNMPRSSDKYKDVQSDRASAQITGSLAGNMNAPGDPGESTNPSISVVLLLQQQAGELAEMRYNQEMDLRHLESVQPTPQLLDQIEDIMEMQQEEQINLQEKHRQELGEDYVSLTGSRRSRQQSWNEHNQPDASSTGDARSASGKSISNYSTAIIRDEDASSARGNSILNSTTAKTRDEDARSANGKSISNYSTAIIRDEDASSARGNSILKSTTATQRTADGRRISGSSFLNSMASIILSKDKDARESLLDTTFYEANVPCNYDRCKCVMMQHGDNASNRQHGGGLRNSSGSPPGDAHKLGMPLSGKNSADSLWSTSKSAPTVLSSKPFVYQSVCCVPIGLSCEPCKPGGKYQQQGKKASSKGDIMSTHRTAALHREIEQAHESRQRIAEAMTNLTIKHTKDVVTRTGQQTREDAMKAETQRMRDSEAAEYAAALQRENDAIAAAKIRIEAAKEAAEERKKIEELAIEDLRKQELLMSGLKKKEIDLTEAAIKRQLAEDEGAAVLRQMKKDDLERVRLIKEQDDLAKKLQQIQLDEIAHRKKAAEMAIANVLKMRKHDEAEAEKQRKNLENAAERRKREMEVEDARVARRRKKIQDHAEAQRQCEEKKAAWAAELRSIEADNQRKIDDDEEAVAAKKRSEQETVLEKQHMEALLQSTDSCKEDEQAFEAHKKRLIQDAVDDRNRRKQYEQEREKQRIASLKTQSPEANLITFPRSSQKSPPLEFKSPPPKLKSSDDWLNERISIPPVPILEKKTSPVSMLENKAASPLNLDPVENAKRRAAAEADLNQQNKGKAPRVASRGRLAASVAAHKSKEKLRTTKTPEEEGLDKARMRQGKSPTEKPSKLTPMKASLQSIKSRKSKEKVRAMQTPEEADFHEKMDEQIEKARMRQSISSKQTPSKLTPMKASLQSLKSRKSNDKVRTTKTPEEENFEKARKRQGNSPKGKQSQDNVIKEPNYANRAAAKAAAMRPPTRMRRTPSKGRKPVSKVPDSPPKGIRSKPNALRAKSSVFITDNHEERIIPNRRDRKKW